MHAEKLKGEELEGQVCGFKIAENLLSVPVLSVQEVIKPQALTKVPLADAAVMGLINLRGQIVTLINLRTKLGLPDEYTDENYMIVIVREGDSLTALMVDEICDVQDISAKSYEPPPETLDATFRKYVDSVHKLEGELLIVLDLEKVLKN